MCPAFSTWEGGHSIPVAEGHIRLAVVSAFEDGFLTTICLAGGQRARRGMRQAGVKALVSEGKIRLAVYPGRSWFPGMYEN